MPVALFAWPGRAVAGCWLALGAVAAVAETVGTAPAQIPVRLGKSMH